MQCAKIDSQVIAVRRLTDSTSVLRIERNGLAFEPGQYLRICVKGDSEVRDYSIYSGKEDDYIEVLVRRIDEGLVSKQLCDLTPGAHVTIEGPYGHFMLEESTQLKPLLFIATGTGISPFHSFVKSYPTLQYQLLHGTAMLDESYDSVDYGAHYFQCVSREAGGAFSGRVTEYLKTIELDPSVEVYLCGNCDMIYDAFDFLESKGIAAEQLHTEVYF